jgi:hypothetical protein
MAIKQLTLAEIVAKIWDRAEANAHLKYDPQKGIARQKTLKWALTELEKKIQEAYQDGYDTSSEDSLLQE